jgi:non-ribosomal peptide synthetase component E (peptide arylation enzyme)
LSSYKVPKTWTVVDVLPTSPVGKIDKAAVRQIVTNPQPTARTHRFSIIH